jgi:hypothetical protein
MTPPRPTGFGALSWLWWPVVLGVLWPLAGLSLLVWPRCPAPGRGGPFRGQFAQNPTRSAVRAKSARFGLLLALPLTACADPDFAGSMGGPPRTAAAVDNPFWCPRRAGP